MSVSCKIKPHIGRKKKGIALQKESVMRKKNTLRSQSTSNKDKQMGTAPPSRSARMLYLTPTHMLMLSFQMGFLSQHKIGSRAELAQHVTTLFLPKLP